MNPRDYQDRAIAGVERCWSGGQAALVVMPTGTGKTVVFTRLIERRLKAVGGRALVLAHRRELIDQAAETIRRMTSLEVDVEMGDDRANEHSFFGRKPVIVSSIQTQSRRKHKFNPNDFSVLVIDEAHHAPASSFRLVVEHYRHPALAILGVTATPDRLDGLGLRAVFDAVAMNYEIVEAVHDGWLVPVRQEIAYIESIDLTGVHTRMGDFNDRELSDELEREKNTQAMVKDAVATMKGRKSIVFCPTVSHATRTAELFNRHEPGSTVMVCGAMPLEERIERISAFRSGQATRLVNVEIASEGFDVPDVSGIVMMRMTKSRARYAQCIGRGTRVLPNTVDGLATPEERRAAIAASAKPNLLVLDFFGKNGRHKLVNAFDILAGHVPAVVRAKAAEMAATQHGCFDQPEIDEAVLAAEEELRQEEKARRERAVQDAVDRRKDLLGVEAVIRRTISNPFDVLDIPSPKSSRLDNFMRPTPRQLAWIESEGFDPSSLKWSEVRRLLSEMSSRSKQGLSSLGQIRDLIRIGVDETVARNMGRGEAKRRLWIHDRRLRKERNLAMETVK